MQKEQAKKVYKFILKHINGWSEKRIKELDNEEIINDPVYEGLINMKEENPK